MEQLQREVRLRGNMHDTDQQLGATGTAQSVVWKKKDIHDKEENLGLAYCFLRGMDCKHLRN